MLYNMNSELDFQGSQIHPSSFTDVGFNITVLKCK